MLVLNAVVVVIHIQLWHELWIEMIMVQVKRVITVPRLNTRLVLWSTLCSILFNFLFARLNYWLKSWYFSLRGPKVRTKAERPIGTVRQDQLSIYALAFVCGGWRGGVFYIWNKNLWDNLYHKLCYATRHLSWVYARCDFFTISWETPW